ncbi:MAG: zinc ribbon domain-containing protein [Clostridia bacterium]|nr:zinc ribbon domain-containing protein [Clostridia bacterium]
MICKYCGYENGDDVAFCGNCGAILTENNSSDINDDATCANNATYYNIKPEEDPGKSQGVISFVLGLVSIVLSGTCGVCAGCYGIVFLAVFFVASIIGIVMGKKGLKLSKEQGFNNSLATLGIVLCIISIVLIIATTVFWLIYTLVAGGAVLTAGILSGMGY